MAIKHNIIGNGRGRLGGLKAEGVRWTVNICSPDCGAMFDMHPVGMYPRHARERVKAIEAGQELITLDNYPIDKIKKHFNTEFFSNSIPYMIAMAIYRGAVEIDFWGCHIQPGADDEPVCKNHPGVEYWLGRMDGMGIKYRVNGNSTLLSLPGGMYGYRWINDY